MNVLYRMASNAAGYGAPIAAATYYAGWAREALATKISKELDPVAAGFFAGEVGAVAVGATLEIKDSKLPDSIQRGIGRLVGTVLGVAAGLITAKDGRYISGALSGGFAGFMASNFTSRAAPNWGNLAHER